MGIVSHSFKTVALIVGEISPFHQQPLGEPVCQMFFHSSLWLYPNCFIERGGAVYHTVLHDHSDTRNVTAVNAGIAVH